MRKRIVELEDVYGICACTLIGGVLGVIIVLVVLGGSVVDCLLIIGGITLGSGNMLFHAARNSKTLHTVPFSSLTPVEVRKR